MKLECLYCKNNFESNNPRKKFCSTKCKNLKNKCNCYSHQRARGISRKRELVKRLGGFCQKCGYNKNLAALAFHHRDPSLKSFQLDRRSLGNRTMEIIEKEFLKCDLLCHNCHAEIHHPEYE